MAISLPDCEVNYPIILFPRALDLLFVGLHQISRLLVYLPFSSKPTWIYIYMRRSETALHRSSF